MHFRIIFIFFPLFMIKASHCCVPIPPRPQGGSAANTTTPPQEESSETTPEMAKTKLYIKHIGKSYICNFHFSFKYNQGIVIMKEGYSECIKTSQDIGFEIEFLEKHDFLVTTSRKFDLRCNLYAVFEETAGGIFLTDTVVRQSLKCSPEPGQCLTEDGTDFPNTCSFPFIYQDRIYQACTDWKDGVQGDRLWCATETLADKTMVLDKWSWCNSVCGYCGGKSLILTTSTASTTSTTESETTGASGTCKTVNGKLCKFPFKEGNNEYTICAKFKNLYHWCAVTTDLDGSYTEWDKCDTKLCQLEGEGKCQTVSGPDSHKTCIFPFKDGSITYRECAPYLSTFWCATSLKADGSFKTWGYCSTDGTCELASKRRSSDNSRKTRECGYDCFLNTRKQMKSFTADLSQDLLQQPSPIVGKLTNSSWNILPGEKFQFLIGQLGVDLLCPEGTTFSKFEGESRITVSCTGDYMFSVIGYKSGTKWNEEKNVNFGCNPCPTMYQAIPGYISFQASVAVHKLVENLSDCEMICERSEYCQSFQFEKHSRECVLHGGKAKLDLSKTGYQVCRTQQPKCQTPMIRKADRIPDVDSIRKDETVTYTCTGTPQSEMIGDPVLSCTSNGLDKPLPVCQPCCNHIELKFQLGSDHFDNLGYYDRYLIQANLKNRHVWYKSLSGNFSFWKENKNGKGFWVLGETLTSRTVGSLETDGCPYDPATMDQWQWQTPLRVNGGKQQRDFIQTIKGSCGGLTDDYLEIFTIPVGQGDSTIIKCPKSGKHIIVDMGSLKHVEELGSSGLIARQQYIAQVTKYFKQPGYTVTHIFLTHPDSDHINYGIGDDGLLNNLAILFTNMNIYFGGSEAQWRADGKGDIVDKIKQSTNFNHKFFGPKLIMQPETPIKMCDDAVTMNILTAGNEGNHNTKSLVMMLKTGTFAMMFMGDYEHYDLFENLISTYKEKLKADVILVPHHGSDLVTGSKKDSDYLMKLFYNYVNPTCAFISSHINGVHGHPRMSPIKNVCYTGLPIKNQPNPYKNHKIGEKNGQGWPEQNAPSGTTYGECDSSKTEIFQTTVRQVTTNVSPIDIRILYARVYSNSEHTCGILPWVV